ncbi:MAG: zinc ribbon domain-containing protein [Bacteroidota bacterium]
MPTYEYRCKECKYTFEELQPMSAPALTTCPSCREETLVRMISAGGGLIFKGSGFYITDYKRNSKSDGKGAGKEAKQKKSEEKSSDSSTSKPNTSPPRQGQGGTRD